MRLHKPNNVNFELTLNVPLDTIQSNGFFISSKLIHQSMQKWLTTDRVCLLTKSRDGDIKQSKSCAQVIFMDCKSLKLYCRCIDGDNADQLLLKQFIQSNRDQQLIYTPQGYGKFEMTHTSGTVVNDFKIQYVHIQIPK